MLSATHRDVTWGAEQKTNLELVGSIERCILSCDFFAFGRERGDKHSPNAHDACNLDTSCLNLGGVNH